MAISPLWRKAETPAGSGWRNARIVGAVLVVATLTAVHPVRSKAQESPARLFAAHALALRTAGVAGDKAATEVLADMPGSGMAGSDPESHAVLWRPFFANAVVKLGRLRSPAPAALYYDPLLDVAIFTLWERRQGDYRVASARALPGERLADPDGVAALRPQWTAAKDGPVAALRRITATRLDAFRQAHPAESNEAGRDAATFAAAAADMRAALPRLVWNMAMRAQWAEDGSGWMGPALETIDEALSTHDAAAIVAAAPDTDAATAAALARLPTAFAEELTLDLTLEAGGNDRLMVASSPADGHVFTLALCRLDREVCRLRRFLLTSLAE